jgi:Abortive infection alpha
MPDDDAELIKAGAQGIVEGVMKPFGDLLQALLGPGMEEAGLLIRDSIRTYRVSRTQRLLGRADAMFKASETTPGPITPKLLITILENGSLEDNDDLQDRWAALLVNSSGSNRSRDLLPSAPEILKQLNPWEVLLLQNCFDALTMDSLVPYPHPIRQSQLRTITDWENELRFKRGFDQSGMGYNYDFNVMIDNLLRLGLPGALLIRVLCE